MSTAELLDENARIAEQIRTLTERNDKLQADMMRLNAERDALVDEGHKQVAELTNELRELDEEREAIESDCKIMIKYICEHDNPGAGVFSSVFEESNQYDERESEVVETSSTRVALAPMRHDDRGSNVPSVTSSQDSPGSSSVSDSHTSSHSEDSQYSRSDSFVSSGSEDDPVDPAEVAAAPGGRQNFMMKISHKLASSKKSMKSRLPPRPSGLGRHESTPSVLEYKADPVSGGGLFQTGVAHLNNFRRHSGPYRKNQETIVL